MIFSAADFASAAELQPLIDFIPKDAYVAPAVIADEHQPPLGLAADIHKKLATFSLDAHMLYQKHMTAFSSASKNLAHPVEFKTMSLDDIARTLLPGKADWEGKYEPALRYALHSALLDDDTETFRTLNQITGGKHVSYLYRVSPASSATAIRNVQSRVRYIMDFLGNKTSQKGKPTRLTDSLWTFIVKSRKLIKESRQNRSWTDHGVLEPNQRRSHPHTDWTEEQQEFLRFMELWSGSQFRPGTPLHTMGSTVLRLTGMYKSAKQLNAKTGWTFLQEVGRFPSWEPQIRHKFPLPGATALPGGGYDRPSPGPYVESMRDDVAAGYRKDWGALKAYCIDAPSSFLLDDAISVEPTETPGEHWIHVHSSDPTAFIKPNSKLSEFAEIIAMDHFLPGFRYSMFPDDFFKDVVMKQLSLDHDRPCLTFSTRLNEAGEVLDVKVQPGTLQDVMFISPDEIAKVCPPVRAASPKQQETDSLVVGPPQDAEFTSNRKMVSADDLSPSEKADLQTMHRLLRAVDAIRLERGAIPQSRPSRSVRVMFDGKGNPSPTVDPEDPTSWSGDPAIEVRIDEANNETLVGMAMTLAGESAAKWCHARGIPVPFHTQPGALRNPAALRALGDEIRAMTDRGETIPVDMWRRFDREAGPTAMAVEPGPVTLMGMEMYVKVTSPLRRLSDCLAHWQIHAHLNSHPPPSPPHLASDTASLPWTGPALREKLDALRLPTHTSRSLSRLGVQPWAHQAFLRAWKFGEAPLPEKFRFTARGIYTALATGDLDFLGFRAVLRKRDLAGVIMMKDLKAGDELEVEVSDVDAYVGVVYVSPLRRLPREGEVSEGDAEPVAA